MGTNLEMIKVFKKAMMSEYETVGIPLVDEVLPGHASGVKSS